MLFVVGHMTIGLYFAIVGTLGGDHDRFYR
jgi:hypothetical protein